MDTAARRRKAKIAITSDSVNHLYPHDVNFYTSPPGPTISLCDFQDLAFERLQLLRIIEEAGLKGHKPYSDDWRKCIREDLSAAGLKKYVRLMKGDCGQTDLDVEARRADHISHFIFRLAYCRSEELRRWFLNRELDWFRIRFSALSTKGIRDFLNLNHLVYNPISVEDKQKYRADIMSSSWTSNSFSFETTDYYQVPFTEVCSLVKTRKVFLKQGMAFIPSSDLAVCILSKFRARLNEDLNIYYHRLPSFDDERINSLLSNLHLAYTGKNYVASTDKDRLNPESIDGYAKKHFPLCMSHLHDCLRTNHHLKHFSRLQYGLFLKGIGLLYEDAVTFFRKEFTKTMDSNKFDKEHLYNIKFNYGKVGSMTNYTPHSCIKIITGSVGMGDTHGCPFRHWDATIMKQKLTERGVESQHADEIKNLVKQQHYQIACRKYFEAVHGQPPATGINHPIQYYEDSLSLVEGTSKAKK